MAETLALGEVVVVTAAVEVVAALEELVESTDVDELLLEQLARAAVSSSGIASVRVSIVDFLIEAF